MRIVDMIVTPIAIADPPLRNAPGLHQPYALRVIVELVSEDGLSGFGEIAGSTQVMEAFPRIRDLVIGRDAFDLARLRKAVDEQFERTCADAAAQDSGPGQVRLDIAARVFGALEVAALDLIGNAVSRPVCDLLGGRVRDEVPFSAYLFYKQAGGGGEGADARDDQWGEALTPAALVEQARLMVDRYGFRSLKLKGGVLPPEQEVETMLALRDAFGPTVPLRLDPNAAWSVQTSINVGKGLAGTLEYLEDPTGGRDGMAAVRRGLLQADIETPLATNMAVTSFDHIREAVQTDAVQVILGDHHFWGGLVATTQLGRVCQTFGLGLSMHSNTHLGVSLMAMTHVAAATPHLTYDSDTHYPWQSTEDEILVGGKVSIQDGAVRVPDQPGLGIEIDRDALARGRERFETCGIRDRDDEGEMRRRIDPTWRRISPRW